MAFLRLEQLQEGMELDGDVLDRNRQPLVRAGTVLTNRDLRRFKMWGIQEVEVAGIDEGEESNPQVDPVLLKEYEPQAQELFRHTDLEHPYMVTLFQACLLKLVHHHGRGGGGS